MRHYDNFQIYGSINALFQRISEEFSDPGKIVIHVMPSQSENGRVILGDSNEYGSDISPFDKEIIDKLLIDKLREVIYLPNWTFVERWHGIYAKYPGEFTFESQPIPGVHVSTGTGGSEMTMSMGIADRFWAGPEPPLITEALHRFVLSCKYFINLGSKLLKSKQEGQWVKRNGTISRMCYFFPVPPDPERPSREPS